MDSPYCWCRSDRAVGVSLVLCQLHTTRSGSLLGIDAEAQGRERRARIVWVQPGLHSLAIREGHADTLLRPASLLAFSAATTVWTIQFHREVRVSRRLVGQLRHDCQWLFPLGHKSLIPFVPALGV